MSRPEWVVKLQGRSPRTARLEQRRHTAGQARGLTHAGGMPTGRLGIRPRRPSTRCQGPSSTRQSQLRGSCWTLSRQRVLGCGLQIECRSTYCFCHLKTAPFPERALGQGAEGAGQVAAAKASEIDAAGGHGEMSAVLQSDGMVVEGWAAGPMRRTNAHAQIHADAAPGVSALSATCVSG